MQKSNLNGGGINRRNLQVGNDDLGTRELSGSQSNRVHRRADNDNILKENRVQSAAADVRVLDIHGGKEAALKVSRRGLGIRYRRAEEIRVDNLCICDVGR